MMKPKYLADADVSVRCAWAAGNRDRNLGPDCPCASAGTTSRRIRCNAERGPTPSSGRERGSAVSAAWTSWGAATVGSVCSVLACSVAILKMASRVDWRLSIVVLFLLAWKIRKAGLFSCGNRPQ